MGTTTTTTATTPSRRVRPPTTTSSSTTPKRRDSPSPNSNSNSNPNGSIIRRSVSSPEPSVSLPRSRTTKSTTTTLPSPAIPPPPTTTRKSLLLLSKPKPKSSLPNSPPPPPQSQSLSQSHPIKPSSPNTNKTTPINSPTRATTTPSRRDQHATLLLPSSRHPHTHQQQQQHLTIATLQSELLSLRTQLQQAQSLNLDLQSQNSNLSQQLAAALSKISSLTSSTTTNTHQESKEFHNPEFHDIQKLISDKLERPAIIKEDTTKTSITKTLPAQVFTIAPSTASTSPSPPPPPPPPLPRRPAAKTVTSQKASAVVELYQSLATKHGNGYPSVKESSYKTSSAHNSIVDEIQNRSSHLLAIKKDIETKGELINDLIQKVLAAAYTDIEDVLCFVDWLDKQLSLLADEQAVLKHFKWPEKKADSMREAAIEYRNLKLLGVEVSSYRDDIEVPCGVALKKMARLLDKSERSLQRLIQLRSSAMVSYRSQKIPTDWMLDTGIVSKIKQASINLAKAYVKRVTLQLESSRYSERESTQEALVLQGVHFAYRAHQLCGGLDSETLCAIEEMRGRVVAGDGGSTQQQLFGGIPSA